VNIAGYDDSDPTLRTEHVTFRNNLFDDVNHTVYGTNAKALLVGGGPAYLVFDRNTIIHTNSAVLYAYGASMPGLVYTNNISQHHKYGIMGDNATTGTPTITKYFPGGVVQCNVLAGGTASLYPKPNGFPTVDQWNASFVDAAAGDYRLIAGSAVATSGCSGTTPGVDVQALNSAVQGTSTSTPTDPPPTTPPPNQTPIADAGGPYTTAVNTLMSSDGTASSDPDGTVLDYVWHWGDEILVRAADLPAAAVKGSEWLRTTQADAAGGAMLLNPDKGAAKRAAALASPGSYVEFTVNAAAGVPYYLWLRMRASGNSYSNDSLYLQFNGAVDGQGAALARIGTTSALSLILEEGNGAGVSGWGWNDSSYGGASAVPIYFAQGGLQTIRIQAREDGVAWDQLILSSAAHTTRPGALKNDTTIADESLGTSTGVSAGHRYMRAGSYPLRLVVTDAGGATAAATATVTVK
jgi:hypothetical protein